MSAEARVGGRPALFAGGAVVGLASVVFASLLFGGRVLFERDIHSLYWGQSAAFTRAVQGGAWPFWNPWQGLGQPMWANPGAQVLYPFTWLNLVVRPEDYYTFYAFGHLVLAGLGMLALGRALRMTWEGALAGAAVYMLSGPLLSSVNLWQHFAGAAWMPLIVAMAVRTLDRPSPVRVVAWSLIQSLQILSGSADLVALTAVPQAGVLTHRLVFGGRALGASRLAATATAAALAVGLTAAQWLPAMDLLRSSMRARQSEEDRTHWSMPPALAAQAFVPLFPQDLPLRTELRRTLYDGREPLFASLYLGLPALALALAASISRRRRTSLAGAALVLFSLWLALGRNGLAWFWALSVLPPLALFRYPVKTLLLGALGFALLCALGFEAWRAARPSRAAAARLGGLVAAPALAAILAAWWLRANGLSFLSPSPEAPLDVEAVGSVVMRVAWSGYLGVASAVLLVLSARQRSGIRYAAVAAGLAILDLLFVHHGLNKEISGAVVRETPEAVAVLRADGAQRLYAFDYFLRPAGSPRLLGSVEPVLARMPTSMRHIALAQEYPTSPARWGLRGSFDADVVGLDRPERQGLRLLAITVQNDPARFLRLLQVGAVTHVVARHSHGLETLEQLSVLRTPAAGEVRVLRVPGSLPRAFVATQVRVADGLEAYRALLDPALEPHSTVLLPDPVHASPGSAAAWRIEILDERADRLAMTVTTDKAGFLVVTDGYDPGWRASVDGRSVPVLRANVAFRGVAVPAGSHDVRLLYRPPGLPTGLALSALSLAAVLAILATSRSRAAGAGEPLA